MTVDLYEVGLLAEGQCVVVWRPLTVAAQWQCLVAVRVPFQFSVVCYIADTTLTLRTHRLDAAPHHRCRPATSRTNTFPYVTRHRAIEITRSDLAM